MDSGVSVIIPTFNRLNFLRRTIQTILNQTLTAHEIIVVDDHSTDGTIQALKKEFGHQVITILNKGKGPGAARNAGLEIATGKFIKFFDSDDLMTSNMIEVQARELANSTKAFITGPYFYAKESNLGIWTLSDNVVLNYFPFDNTLPLWHFMMIDSLFITIPGMLFRKDFLDKVGPWREDVTAYEDWDYLFRLSLLEPRPLHTNECAFLYRLHDSQTTALNFTNQQRDLDKGKVLLDLYNTYIRSGEHFNNVEKMCFVNKFVKLYRMDQEGHPLIGNVKKFNTGHQQLVSVLLRIRNKWGRLRTKTSWQPCHGPFKSKARIDAYLKLIN